MNEDSGPLFKYTPEISSQFLIQTNENQEFVQIPGISDDLLLTGFEDGTVTWTLTGLPVLLNDQPLLINQINTESEPQQELLQDILSQAAIEISDADVQSIECPLEIPDKEFLANNGLFISNEPELPQQLIENTFETASEDEIQSSDVSSQEAFIDINGLLIPQESILNLNNDDLLFNIEDTQPTSSHQLINTHGQVPTLVQNQDEELRVENNPETVFTYDEPASNLVKILNIDGTLSMVNVDELLNMSVLKDVTDYDNDEQNVPIEDEEPDSTVSNEETLNIDDLATIITAYQCKQCEFSCNDQALFLEHFKHAHIQIQPIQTSPEIIPDNLTETTNNNVLFNLNQIKLINGSEILPRIKFLQNSNDTFILPTDETKEFEITEPHVEDNINIDNSFTIEPVDTSIPNIDNSKAVNITCSNVPQLKVVNDDYFEKRIMRVKRKKKSAANNNKRLMVQQQIPLEPKEMLQKYSSTCVLLRKKSIQKEVEPRRLPDLSPRSPPVQPTKQLIYLCSDCGKEFYTVDTCKTHMIEIHKFRLIDDISEKETPIESKEEPSEEAIDDPMPKPEENKAISKNKNIIDKFLTQDIMKTRRNKCTKTGCQYRFAKPELLARHESCHIEGMRGVFKCPECGEEQTSWRLCSIHLWRCHQMDIDLYACPLCAFKGSTLVKLKQHLKIHCDERDYVCSECGRGFKQPNQLRNHRIIHLDPAVHEVPHWYIRKHCDKCGKMFADYKCLKKHVQAVHSKLKPFICNVCGHSCSRKAMLQMHLRQHTGEKPYSCKLCFYKTGDHNSLRRHEMRHTGTRPYKCPHCAYTAIQSNSYKNHLSNKHPGMSGSFCCTDCNFKSVNEESYLSHLNDHKIGLIKKSAEPSSKLSQNQILYDQSNLIVTDITGDNNNIIIQLPNSKDLDAEDDETQNCFLSLGDVNEEQTVDTGGITIPADPDPIDI